MILVLTRKVDTDNMQNSITGDIDNDTDNTIKIEDVENDYVFEETHDDAIDMFGENDCIGSDKSRSENNDDHHTEQRSKQYSSEDDPNSDESTGRYNLRGSRERSYSRRFEHAMDNPASTKSYDYQMLQKAMSNLMDGETPLDIQRYITGFIMTQMTATTGIKKHGERSVEALLIEFCQLDNREVFKGLMASDLTPIQRKEALRAVNLIKEK